MTSVISLMSYIFRLFTFCEKTPKEIKKGNIFVQLISLNQLQFFKLDRKIDIEKEFFEFMNHHNNLDNNYSKLVANIPFLMSLK